MKIYKINREGFSMKKAFILLLMAGMILAITIVYYSRENINKKLNISNKTMIKGDEEMKTLVQGENGNQKQDIQQALAQEVNGIKKVDDMFHVQISIGNQSFTASLYDNISVRALLERLPMSLQMDELHGSEKYYYFSEGLPTVAQSASQIYTGDLKLFGSDCLVLFYQDVSNSYTYTSLGRVDDIQGFVDALGNGSVQVKFEKID